MKNSDSMKAAFVGYCGIIVFIIIIVLNSIYDRKSIQTNAQQECVTKHYTHGKN